MAISFNPGMTSIDDYLHQLTQMQMQKSAARGGANSASRAGMAHMSTATPHMNIPPPQPGMMQKMGDTAMGVGKSVATDMGKDYLKGAIKGTDWQSMWNEFMNSGLQAPATSGAYMDYDPAAISALMDMGIDTGGMGAIDAASGMDWASLLAGGMSAV